MTTDTPTTAALPDLLPCPFCGTNPRLTQRPDNRDGTEFFAAVACYCDGYSACAHKMAVRPTQEQATAEAVQHWNTRAALASQPAPVERDVPNSSATEAGARWQADQHLRALLRYTEGFCASAIEHGMKAGPTANAIAHVERAGKALHELVHAWADVAEKRATPPAEPPIPHRLVVDPPPLMDGMDTAAQAVKWEGGEGWESLAWELCADEHGEEACTELIWEGGPIPEPWGDRWLKYEDEAKRLIALVHKHVPPAATPPAPAVQTVAQEPVAYPGAMARVRKALADRRFRDASEPEDLLRMAANVIAEDGTIIAHMEAKALAAAPSLPQSPQALTDEQQKRLDDMEPLL